MLITNNVEKKYNGKYAVNDLSFTLENGHIYGLLGPNGSGKSTWMKMAAGLVVPNQGSISLDDKRIGPETKKHIAYMSTEPFYYQYMKISDVGSYYRDFFEDFDEDRFRNLISRMDLDPKMKISSLSSGMAAKLKIAATMSRHAEVYLLDEPFNGIDLIARDTIVSTILECIDENSIAVISSHMVEELEKIVDYVIFLSEGKKILEGDVEDLRQERGRSAADIYREIYGSMM